MLISIDPMPTYEYFCEKCEQTFEVFQSMKDEPFKTCPKDLCRQEVWGEGTVKRLLGTGAGLLFKGSGFYITDYRSSGYKEGAKKEAGPAPGDSAKKGGEKSEGAKGGGEKSSGGSNKPPSTGT
jgi:putative FmdB family regulatory protein